MKWKDKLRFVRQNLKKNKSRVFMTVLATAMGCSFLIVLASVGFGLQKSVVDNITKGRLLTEIDIHGIREDKGYRQISDKEIAVLESIDHVKAVTRRYRVKQFAEYRIGDLKTSGQPIVAHMPAEIAAGFELAAGRMPQRDDEVIVGFHFADQLRPSAEQSGGAQVGGGGDAAPPANGRDVSAKAKELLGATMEMQVKQWFGKEQKMFEVPVTVVGIAKAPGREWIIDANVYVSEAVMKQIESFTQTAYGVLSPPDQPANAAAPGGARIYEEVKVYADDVKNVQGVVDKLTENRYASHSIVNQLEEVNTLFLIMKTGLVLVGTIAVLIASIGIYNTMTMAVTERTPDIGIMKAIGAHPKTIRGVFLIESGCIGLFGAVIGTAVAYAVGYAVNLVLPEVIRAFLNGDPPEGLRFSYIPPTLVLISVSISIGVAVLSGVRPAVRATRVDVLKALRRDL